MRYIVDDDTCVDGLDLWPGDSVTVRGHGPHGPVSFRVRGDGTFERMPTPRGKYGKDVTVIAEVM